MVRVEPGAQQHGAAGGGVMAILTVAEVEAVASATLNAPPIEKAMHIVSLLLVDMIRTRTGAETAAEHLRDQGWKCTPPPTAKTAKRKAA